MSKRLRQAGPGLFLLAVALLWLSQSGATGTVQTIATVALVTLPFVIAVVWIGLLVVQYRAVPDPFKTGPEADYYDPDPPSEAN